MIGTLLIMRLRYHIPLIIVLAVALSSCQVSMIKQSDFTVIHPKYRITTSPDTDAKQTRSLDEIIYEEVDVSFYDSIEYPHTIKRYDFLSRLKFPPQHYLKKYEDSHYDYYEATNYDITYERGNMPFSQGIKRDKTTNELLIYKVSLGVDIGNRTYQDSLENPKDITFTEVYDPKRTQTIKSVKFKGIQNDLIAFELENIVLKQPEVEKSWFTTKTTNMNRHDNLMLTFPTDSKQVTIHQLGFDLVLAIESVNEKNIVYSVISKGLNR